MTSVHSLLVALATIILYCHCAVPAPPMIISDTDENLELCISKDEFENHTYTCLAGDDRGTVVWLLGDYSMGDRDEFLQTDGLLIRDASVMKSDLTVFENAAEFLFQSFGSDVVDISCYTVYDGVNTVRSNDVIQLYRDFSPVEPPEWQVTSCNDDGSRTLSISYQSVDDCLEESLSYTISLPNGDSRDLTENELNNLFIDVKCEDSVTTTVTMTVSSDETTRDIMTDISDATCNVATIGNCPCTSDECGDNDMYITLSCNFPSGTELWSCQFTEDGSRVVDVYDGKPIYCQTRVPVFDNDFDCGDGPDPPEPCDNGLIVGFAVGLFVAGLVIGFIIGVIILLYVWKVKKRNTTSPSESHQMETPLKNEPDYDETEDKKTSSN